MLFKSERAQRVYGDGLLHKVSALVHDLYNGFLGIGMAFAVGFDEPATMSQRLWHWDRRQNLAHLRCAPRGVGGCRDGGGRGQPGRHGQRDELEHFRGPAALFAWSNFSQFGGLSTVSY